MRLVVPLVAVLVPMVAGCAGSADYPPPPDEVATTGAPPAPGTGPGTAGDPLRVPGDLRAAPLPVHGGSPEVAIPPDLYLETDRGSYDVERDSWITVVIHVGADAVSVPAGATPTFQWDSGEGAWVDVSQAEAEVASGVYGAGTFALLDAAVEPRLLGERVRLTVPIELGGVEGSLSTPPFELVARPSVAGQWRGKLVAGDETSDVWIALAEQRRHVAGKIDHSSSRGRQQSLLSGYYDYPDLTLSLLRPGATFRGTVDTAGRQLLGVVHAADGHALPLVLVRTPE